MLIADITRSRYRPRWPQTQSRGTVAQRGPDPGPIVPNSVPTSRNRPLPQHELKIEYYWRGVDVGVRVRSGAIPAKPNRAVASVESLLLFLHEPRTSHTLAQRNADVAWRGIDPGRTVNQSQHAGDDPLDATEFISRMPLNLPA